MDPVTYFKSQLQSHRLSDDFVNTTPVPIAAIRTLIHAVRLSTATTTSELLNQLKETAAQLRSLQCTLSSLSSEIDLSSEAVGSEAEHLSDVSVRSGCDLFFRFIRSVTGGPNVQMFRTQLISQAEVFVESAALLRDKSAAAGVDFIQDDCIVLVHSFSRVVMATLAKAYAMNKRFKVFVTESRPTGNGIKTLHYLRSHSIPCTLILDSSIAYVIHRCSLVLSGAEGVVENGGIINHIGTFQLAMISKMANKPFYVAVESYKFVRLYPLSGVEVGGEDVFAFGDDGARSDGEGEQYTGMDGKLRRRDIANVLDDELVQKYRAEMKSVNPLVDYTPPNYLTLLFTDKGVLTPSAVSDELIKMFS